MRRWLAALAMFPIVLLWLACGLGPVPCSEARPRRDRAVAAYHALRQADLARSERSYAASERARAYGADSVEAQASDAAQRDLRHLDGITAAVAAHDESTVSEHVRELGITSLNGHHPTELAELEGAQRAVETCTP